MADMKCKFEHDGDCCNSGASQYMCKCKKPCNEIIPMTNADRIRAMSDKELAEYLVYHNPFHTENNCLEWLQRPVEVEQ